MTTLDVGKYETKKSMQRKERVEGRKEVKWLSRQNGVEVVLVGPGGQAAFSYKVLRTTNQHDSGNTRRTAEWT